jgi:cytochrome c oxidase subunit 4
MTVVRPPRALLLSWLALLSLLALTVMVAYWPLGTFNTVVALTIATVKALIVAAVFMELRDGRGLLIPFAGAGLFWLAILLWLAFADYTTRPDFPPSVSPPVWG